MPTWPSSLPDKPLQQGYREAPQKDVIRTAMDQGPDKIRRRGTTKPNRFNGEFEFTESELSTFRSFVDSDLDDGTKRFDWEHPITGAAAEFRFVFSSGEAPYEINAAGGSIYHVAATLEQLV